MTLYINSVIANIESTKREVAGTGPVVALQKVVQYVQQHRGLSAAILNGNDLASRLSEAQRELHKAIDSVDTMLKEASISSENVLLWSIQKQRIIETQQTALAHRLTAAESSTKHTKIVQDVMLLSEETLVEFDLLLDPVKNTYFLTAGSINDEGRTKLAGIFSNVTLFFFDFMRNVEKATQSDLSMKAALESKRKLSTLSA